MKNGSSADADAPPEAKSKAGAVDDKTAPAGAKGGDSDSMPGGSRLGGKGEGVSTSSKASAGPPPSVDAPFGGSTWPAYVSHKVVRAAQIVAVDRSKDPAVLMVQADDDSAIPEVFVPTEPGMANRAEVGGAAVVYEDGFRSISPQKAFEDGYTLQVEGAADETVTGSGLHMVTDADGGARLHGMWQGEAVPSVSLPVGHRLIDVFHEMLQALHLEASAAVAEPGPPGDLPTPAVPTRAAEPIRQTASEVAAGKTPLPVQPMVQLSPQQAGMSPPRPIPTDGAVTGAIGQPKNLR